MKPIEELLKNLGRPEVLEFGLVTNRLPSVNIGGKFEPVDDEAPTTDVLLQMLVTMGGSRYIEQLSERPVQWTTRLDGVGVVAVAAIMRKDVVQARFTVARRDAPGAQAAPVAGAKAVGAVRPKDDPASGAAIAAAQQSRPAVDLRRTQQGTGGPQPAAPAQQAKPAVVTASMQSKPAAMPARPSSAGQQPAAAPAPVAHSSASQKAAAVVIPAPPAKAAPVHVPTPAPSPAANPLVGAVPPPDDWDDDDEPTVQTLSPPVSQAPPPPGHALAGDAKAKPARKPGDEPDLDAPARPDPALAALEARAAAEQKAAEERKVAEQKAAEEKAAEQKAAEERRAAAEQKAAEQKAAEQKAAEQKAAEQKAAEQKAAEQKAAEERAAQERVAAERAASDKRAAIERAAAERAVAAERLAAERKNAERAKVERRISTPTSVDAVDVEITTSDAGARAAAAAPAAPPPPAALELVVDPDAVDATVELAAPQASVSGLGRATAAVLSQAVSSAVPSTTPSAAAAPADRPRPDGALVSFLGMAAGARASDLHIVAGRPLLLRIATDLLPRTQPITVDHVERIVRELVPARLRDALERDGACDFAMDHPHHGRFRVNVSRQRTGFKLSMRVIPHEIPTLASLALPESLAGAAAHARGLVLVTGPTGHGKSSTLAAIVDILNRDTAHHILTVEAPIEFLHAPKRALISQREVGAHAQSFASALAASLREDPDVIVIGELHDLATVRAAISASETGHLVLATMNTRSAAKTIDRLIDLFPANEQPQARLSIAGALRLIVGQRLVPSADRTRLHAAVELLPSSIALYTLIRDARTFQIPSLQQRGRAQGVVRLDESLAELVRAQKVTLEVAKQFAESPQELEAHATRAGAARKG
jgi:twitching motility protein PilT